MLDLNAIVSAAISAAIKEATEPLVTRIAALESANDILHRVQGDRIAALETKLSEANLFTQMTPATITADAFVTHLDQQEWFWHKVAGFVLNNGMSDDITALRQRVAELESETQGENRYLNRDDVAALIEEAIDSHCEGYDHDSYDGAVSAVEDANLDDMLTKDDLRDELNDLLNGASVSISI